MARATIQQKAKMITILRDQALIIYDDSSHDFREGWTDQRVATVAEAPECRRAVEYVRTNLFGKQRNAKQLHENASDADLSKRLAELEASMHAALDCIKSLSNGMTLLQERLADLDPLRELLPNACQE